MSEGDTEMTYDGRTGRTAIVRRARAKFLQGMPAELERMSGLLSAMKQCMTLEDAHYLFRIAHSMKGTAPIVGLEAIGHVAGQLSCLWEWTDDVKGDALTPLAGAEQIDISFEYIEWLEVERRTAAAVGDSEEAQSADGRNGPETAHDRDKGKLLLIDDDPGFLDFAVQSLRAFGYDAEGAGGVADAIWRMTEQRYDLIVLDLVMHPEPGHELFKHIQSHPQLKWTPLIVLSGKSDVADKIEMLRMGADDYVTKPFDMDELEARIGRLIIRTRQMEHLAFRDALTGAYNRRYFSQQLHGELQRAIRRGEPVSLVMLDIDFFKKVNDTYGHATGDIVLQGLAQSIRNHLQTTDIFARYGGEEFALLLPNKTSGQAAKSVETILDVVRGLPFQAASGQSFCITFSAGVVQWAEHMTESEWLRAVDDALYAAKEGGRDRVVVFGRPQPGVRPAGPSVRPMPAAAASVLLVDADATHRAIVRVTLSLMNLSVHEAVSAEEALRMARSLNIDLCIVIGDSVDDAAVGRLRFEMKRNRPEARLMYVGSWTADANGHAVVRSLADVWMQRPLSLLELEMKVKTLLSLP